MTFVEWVDGEGGHPDDIFEVWDDRDEGLVYFRGRRLNVDGVVGFRHSVAAARAMICVLSDGDGSASWRCRADIEVDVDEYVRSGNIITLRQ